MAKLHLVCFVVAFGLALTCTCATTYMVGDSSGWDISTDLQTWANDKKFLVGDLLVFQYSSSDPLSEVTKENFKSCNTTHVITTYSNGNTTVPLTKAGERFFVSGNKLYCLGGMKLQVNVQGNQSANSPIAAPQAQPGGGTTTLPSSKSDTPSTIFPSSTASTSVHGGRDGSLFMGLLLAFLPVVAWI